MSDNMTLATARPTGSPAEPKKAFLLGLPSELRNLILEKVLMYAGDWDDCMSVNAAYEPPGVLRANRQLRSEGLAMFEEHNPFAITIHNLKLEPHPGHRIFKKMTAHWQELYMTGTHSRSDFKEWLRMRFEGKNVPKIHERGELELTKHNLMAQPFIIVETLAASGTP